MFYEDVRLEGRETLPAVATAYGHVRWEPIWGDNRNAALRARRAGAADRVQAGDVVMVPIPWKITTKTLIAEPHGVGFDARRDGEEGQRLSWVQTVFQSNQAVAGTTPFCVDGCPADDELPFYWTEAELVADPSRRLKFSDHPSRPAPSVAAGSTRWRAIVSLAVATRKRVTVFDSWVWGFDLDPAGAVSKVGPRLATPLEMSGHLALLRQGVGTAAGQFKDLGWTFRQPPP
jgi:hypothetical protein